MNSSLLRIEQAGIPAHERVAEKQPEQSAQGEVRTEWQLRGPDAFADHHRRETDDRSDERTGEHAEQNRLPAEERADGREKFQVATAHRFPRNFQLAHDAADALERVERDVFAADLDAVVMESQVRGAEVAFADDRFVAMQDELVALTREVIAPQTLFFADDEIGVVAFARPGEGSRRVEPDAFLAENLFAGFENDPQNDVAENRRERRGEQGAAAAGGVHQFRHDEAGDHARHRSANGYFVGDNEVLEVDEGRGDKERDENPVSDRHRPRERFPDAKEKERGQELDGEIAEGNADAAVSAFAAQEEPAQERNVLVPLELGLARRTKRAARLIDRDSRTR